MVGEKKRKVDRFELQVPAKLSVTKKSGDKEYHELITKDICSGGAYFNTDQPIPVGTEVSIDLVLPLEELKKLKGKTAIIKASGAVIRIDQNGMAISFSKGIKISSMPD
ncbi:MAG: PilZ domain-containing protein [Desulfobacterales bacterium]|nr:PilZ domain-containing protein [Desulfobacterales bacterium]